MDLLEEFISKSEALWAVNNQDPLTNISEVKDVRAYFSVSETAFLRFKDEYPGKNTGRKNQKSPAG